MREPTKEQLAAANARVERLEKALQVIMERPEAKLRRGNEPSIWGICMTALASRDNP
jgi:hypothetical protein